MRFAAPRMIILLIVTLCVPAAAEELQDDVPTIVPVASTYRFTDEEPPFEMARPSSWERTPDGMHGAGRGESAGGAFGGQRWLGVLAQSEPCFTDFLSPVTNPIYFENPRTLTEARILFLHQKIPMTALGGDVDLLALQLRAAVTDRLSVIATKSGFATTSSPVVEDGWADINVGLKYTLLANPAMQRLLSIGMTYELPIGSTQTYQGNGGGLFNLFVTGGAELGGWHAVSASGLLLPADRSAESSLWFWSSHLSHAIGRTNFHVLGELNWFHWLGAGESDFPLSIEGGDIFNLGSLGVAGNDIVTGALGFRYKPSDRLEIGMAWEIPLTDRRDTLDNRLTVDCIVRY